jgi:flagellar basal-body rod protein FlgC
MDISASGLTAQRLRMDLISENIANAETTRTETGGPYRRKTAVFREKPAAEFADYLKGALSGASGGVRVSQIAEDTAEGTRVYEPGHPDADADGYVTKPNVNIVVEMVNMVSATRSYEANVTAINSSKAMISRTLEISR